MSETPVNIKSMLETYDHDRPFLRELFSIFLDSMDTQMAILESTMEQGDSSLSREAAHIISGSSANVGAEAVNTLARELERLCIAEDIEAAGNTYNLLKEECGKTKSIIQNFIEDIS